MKSQNENKTNLLSVKFNLNNSRPKNILLLNVDMKISARKEKMKENDNLKVVVKITNRRTEE